MEKEINLNENNFEMNLFYDDEAHELVLIEKELSLLNQAFREFWISILEIEDFTFNMNINACSDSEIQSLNKDHRNKDKPTDVLSFPMQESIREGEYDKFSSQIELGDIFIALGVCKKQADEFNISFLDEFLHLAVHGFLHLIGFDHEVSLAEEKIMEGYELKLIEEIGILKKARA